MFVKKPDPHDEAMEILKDQMANPPKLVHTLIVLNTYAPAHTHTQAQIMADIFESQSQKKPSSLHKEEGLRGSRTLKSGPAGPAGLDTNPAPPPGTLCESDIGVED